MPASLSMCEHVSGDYSVILQEMTELREEYGAVWENGASERIRGESFVTTPILLGYAMHE